ncbi:MAG: hypothetical protein Q9226_004106 [Calogaya cf. arnoldii]
MYAKTAALILGTMAAIGSASPIAPEAKTNSTNEAVTANAYQKLAIEASPQAAQEITYIQVCINVNLSGRCERLRNTKGNCFYSFGK